MAFIRHLMSFGFVPIIALLALQFLSPESFQSLRDAVQPFVARTSLNYFFPRSLPSRSKTPLIISSTTHWSHLEKIAAIAVELAGLGYPITFICGRVFEQYISALHPNIEFTAFLGHDDKMSEEDIKYWMSLPSGPAQEAFAMKRVLVDAMPEQHETIQIQLRALREKYADKKPAIVLFDQTVIGHHPVLLGTPGIRPDASIGISIAPLALDSNDTFPFKTSKLPHVGPDAHAVHWAAYQDAAEEKYNKEINEYWWGKLREMGAMQESYPNIFHGMNSFPDRLLQLGVPGFEFPRSDVVADIRYFGALKRIGNSETGSMKLPTWWDDIEKAKKEGRKIIAVSQGTVAPDLNEIVLPTIEALKERDDVLLIASTVTLEPENIPDLIVPKNTRIAKFVPYDQLLPKVDLLVSNGGYGAVQHALRLGIPMVVSGLAQDKATTNVIVEWSGIGINLGEMSPGAEKIGGAVKEVLTHRTFEEKAKKLSMEFENYDVAKVFDDVIQDTVRHWRGASAAKTKLQF